MQLNSQTQSVIDWFGKIISLNRFILPVLEEIRDRVQRFIIDVERLDEECVSDIGDMSWDDWTSFSNLTRQYPPPEVDPEFVNWDDGVRFLVKQLKLNLWADKSFEDED